MSITTIEELGLISISRAAEEVGIKRTVAYKRIKQAGIDMIDLNGKDKAIWRKDLDLIKGKVRSWTRKKVSEDEK